MRPGRRLTALDSTFLYSESANNPLHIGTLLIFEGQVSFDDLVRHVEQRIHLLPRYRQRLAEVPFNLGHPTLEDDPKFRLENHVKRFQLPLDISEADAIGRVLQEHHPLLDRTRPLWELLSFEGWPGGNTGIVFKIHHALVDGVSGVELMKVLFDFRSDAPLPQSAAQEWKPAPLPSQVDRFISATKDLSFGQMDFLTASALEWARDPQAAADRGRRVLEAMRKMAELDTRKVAATPWNSGPVTADRKLAWVRNPYSDYRAIRSAFGGTVNDVVLTALTEGAARYLKSHGYSTDGWFRIGCPVSVRSRQEWSDLGNRVSMMFPMVPAAPMDPIERLKVVREETERIKSNELPQALELLTSLGGKMTPPSLLALAARIGTVSLDAGAAMVRMSGWKPRPGNLQMLLPALNFIATNVPGVKVTQYLAGHQCLEQLGLLPLGGNLGYGVAILSYRENLCFAMMADPNLVPDVEFMRACVQEAFEELRTAAEKSRIAREADKLGASTARDSCAA